jgi:23S rRNA (pseudouridine1915-N3)-methyltransferase
VRIRVIAIGSRMPGWVREAVDDYLKRFAAQLRVSIIEIEAGNRTGSNPRRAIEVEGERLLAAVQRDEFVASWLDGHMREGRDVALLIGGPDGFAPGVLARANYKWALSKLTFPHALVRVLLAEQLYRAHSVLTNHPYHRE